jgi:hypothetical protein
MNNHMDQQLAQIANNIKQAYADDVKGLILVGTKPLL